MAAKRIFELTPITGAETTSNDLLLVFDVDSGETKQISRSQLAEGVLPDLQPLLNVTRGTQIYVGTGDPTVDVGQDNDIYIDVGNGNLWRKTGTVWSLLGNIRGAQGVPGTPGTPGTPGEAGLTKNIVFQWSVAKPDRPTGDGTPAGWDDFPTEAPEVVDIALWSSFAWQDADGITQGEWSDPIRLTGNPGATWYSGSGMPDGALGRINDFYLDEDTGFVYRKTGATTWTLVANITGPEGPEGQPGAGIDVDFIEIVDELPELPNEEYPEGTIVILRSDGRLYKNVAEAWVDLIAPPSLVGTVRIVNELPTLPDEEYPVGSYVLLSTDNNLYRNEADVWVIAAQSVTATIQAVDTLPTLPDADYPDGAIVLLTTDGYLYQNQDGTWVVLTAPVDLTGAVRTVAALPSLPDSSYPIGSYVLLSSDNKIYRNESNTWVEVLLQAPIVPTIGIVATLPSLPDGEYPLGSLVYNEADEKLYINVDDTWEELTLTVTATGGLPTVSALPALPNGEYPIGTVVYSTADKKLYKNDDNSSWQPVVNSSDIDGQILAAQIAGIEAAQIAGQITGTQIEDGAITTLKIAAGAVTAQRIAVETIDASRIAASAITAGKIAANAVVAGKIAADAITAGNIQAGAIGVTQLAADSVTANKIAAGAVTAAKIDASAVTADKIAANAITTDKIAANAVTAVEIAANSISTEKIQAGAVKATQIDANAVTAGKIAAGAVTTAKLDAQSVTAEKVATNAITADKITANAVTFGKVAAGAIDTAQLRAGAVLADNIASNAVTSTKIQAGAITSTKIESTSINATHMAAGSITAANAALADATVTTAKIGNLAVTTAKIANLAVTSAKIQSLAADKIQTGSLAAGVVLSGRFVLSPDSDVPYASIDGGPPANADVTLTAVNNTLSVTGGGINFTSGTAAVRAGKTSYADTTNGFWLGRDSGTARLNIGGSAQYLRWTGSALELAGNLTLLSGSAVPYSTVNGGPPANADNTASSPQPYSWVSGTKPPANADNTAANVAPTISAASGGLNITGGGLNLSSGTCAVRSGKTSYAATTSGFWLGRDPTNGATLSLGDATRFLRYRDGELQTNSIRVNNGLIDNTILTPASARLHTGGGRTAPFRVQDYLAVNNGTATTAAYVSPGSGSGHSQRRFGFLVQDVFLDITASNRTSSDSNAVTVSYSTNGTTFTTIGTFSVPAGNAESRIFRFTSPASWTNLYFRISSTENGPILLRVNTDNTFESANTAASIVSSEDAAAATGGLGANPVPPPTWTVID